MRSPPRGPSGHWPDRGSPSPSTTSGTGYTSLSQLRTLRVAELKIDRTFLIELDRDERNQAIVRSIIGLADGLGCRVTAEGVESPDIAAWLAAAGCQCAQGFLFSKPLPCEELINRYRRRADTENVHRQHPRTTMEGSWT